MIYYGKQEINEDDINSVVEVLKSDFLTQGPKVVEFENKFAKFVDAKFACAVSNGTAALHLACLALGLKQGDKVLCPAITFAASSNAVLYCGADVEFVDIDPNTFCISVEKLIEKISDKPDGYYKGVIVVDYAGHPAEIKKISDVVKSRKMWIIEDACHSPGAYIENEFKCGDGKYADMTVFSFHPVKHIACGEGGMLTTNSELLYDKISLLRTHGITKASSKYKNRNNGSWYHEMQDLGYNYRMSDILAALGVTQLERIQDSITKRNNIAKIYNKELSALPIKLPELRSGAYHAFHLYVIQTTQRNELFDFLKENEILTQVHYIPIYKHPFYVEKYGEQSLKETENFYNKCLSLPMYPSITKLEVEYVIKKIKEFFQ